MAIKDILTGAALNDISPLRRRAEPVTVFDTQLAALVEDLIDTLFAHEIAVGLAAPQVGVSLQVAAINVAKKTKSATLVIVNPRVLSASGSKERKKESCMSLPGVRGEVIRRSNIALAYQDSSAAHHTLDAHGFLARVIAHEVDHLDGILYTARLEPGTQLEDFDFKAFTRAR